MIIVILNKFATRCCLVRSLKRTGSETDHCAYFVIWYNLRQLTVTAKYFPVGGKLTAVVGQLTVLENFF